MDAPATGLTPTEVAERVAEGKTNSFTADTSRSAWNIVRANVFTLFNAIVFACFFVLFLVGRWQDALFGFAAFGNAIIGCGQEFRAKAALDKLALLNAPHARVLRSGRSRRSSRARSCSTTSWCSGRATRCRPMPRSSAAADCRSTSRC